MRIKQLMFGIALGFASSGAFAINVGGVVWDPNSGDDYFAVDTMYEKVVVNTGDILSGYGKILNINGETTQSVFCPGCELTYQFDGFKLDQILDTNANSIFGDAGDNAVFTGGTVKFYVDFSADFALDNVGSAGDDSGANQLWLEMNAATQSVFFGSTSATGTLFSDLTQGALGTGTEGGNGFGNFDVIAGLAKLNFDTNTQANGSDFRFTSSFQPRSCVLTNSCVSAYQLFGSNDMYSNSIAVPEPQALALLGLGLIGFVYLQCKRKYA